jgi:hypothetical protein
VKEEGSMEENRGKCREMVVEEQRGRRRRKDPGRREPEEEEVVELTGKKKLQKQVKKWDDHKVPKRTLAADRIVHHGSLSVPNVHLPQ